MESKGPVVSGEVGAGGVVDGDGVVGASVVRDERQTRKQKTDNTMTRGRKHYNNGTNETHHDEC